MGNTTRRKQALVSVSVAIVATIAVAVAKQFSWVAAAFLAGAATVAVAEYNRIKNKERKSTQQIDSNGPQLTGVCSVQVCMEDKQEKQHCSTQDIQFEASFHSY